MTRLMMLALALTLCGCDGVMRWFSGVDREDYVWASPSTRSTGTAALNRDLQACMADAPVVSARLDRCMIAKGYRKDWN